MATTVKAERKRRAVDPHVGGEATISVHTRELGYGTEDFIADAFITTEVDGWGKRTIFVARGQHWDRIYLFPDEYEVI